MATQPEIYSLKITLLDFKPKIWRRVYVSSASTLRELHFIIQASMGWGNSHMHEYIIDGKYYETGAFTGDQYGMDVINGTNVKLNDVIGPDEGFLYTYDMGDSWEHEIFVEKVIPYKTRMKIPSCKAGARACPPDDCGGTDGYADVIKTMAGPDSEEKEELKGWLRDYGGITDFNPAHFDRAEANMRIEYYVNGDEDDDEDDGEDEM
ncbi:hypothetical protein BGX26_004815 [Mortierella sp. AD094]|nr:hypothetical protein BGX26_004815 [Mortierella sp. AD094]